MYVSLLSRRIASRGSVRSFASRALAPGLHSLLEKRLEDVVIIFAKRTAMGKAKKGQFKDTPVDEILSGLLKVSAHFDLFPRIMNELKPDMLIVLGNI